jgi:stearoyl-CoA desaturase (Delta-9 desaturase)
MPGTDTATTLDQPLTDSRGPKPLMAGEKDKIEQIALYFFVIIPFLAVLAAIPLAWGWGLGWHDIVIAFVFYTISGLGVTVGLHRYLTHGSFKAKRPLRIALGIAGTMAIEGPVIRWVADHRRHHAFADKEGDPHSPWRYGETLPALMKGLWYAHVGWLFDSECTNQERFTPDLLQDKALVRMSNGFGAWVAASMLAPALIGGLWSWSWHGALTAFFWASLVRVCVLHHVTWSINSICHSIGERPFVARDKSTNFWPLAILSFGESWHNSHHADPTCARHGMERGQLDISARVIALFEWFGWVYDVRWPTKERMDARRTPVAVAATTSD